MKTYKFSDLVHKRSEIMTEAENHGVILQRLETNTKLRDEFVLVNAAAFKELTERINKMRIDLESRRSQGYAGAGIRNQ